MIETTCPHDDDPLVCPPCQGRNPLVRAHSDRSDSGSKWSHPFTARYTIRCACGDIIKPGEPARTHSDEWGERQTAHAECAGEVA